MASVSSTPLAKRHLVSPKVASLCRMQNPARCGPRLTHEVIQLRRLAAQPKCKVNNFGLARKNSLMEITEKKKLASPPYELQEGKRTTWVTIPGERIGVENKYIATLGMNVHDFFNPVFDRVPPIGKGRQQQPLTQHRKQPPQVPKRPLPNAQRKVAQNRKMYNKTLSQPDDFEPVKAADVYQVIETHSGARTASDVMSHLLPTHLTDQPDINTAHGQNTAAIDALSELSVPQASSLTQSLSGTMSHKSTSELTLKGAPVSSTTNPLRRVHSQKLDELLSAEHVRLIDVRELTAKLNPTSRASSIGNACPLHKDNKRKDKKKLSPDEVLRTSNRPKPATKEQSANWQTSGSDVSLGTSVKPVMMPEIRPFMSGQLTPKASCVVNPSLPPIYEDIKHSLHFWYSSKPEQLPPAQVAQVLASPRREPRLQLHSDEFLYPEAADFARLPLRQQGTTRDVNIAPSLAERTRELYEHAQQLRGELQRRDRIDELFAVGPYRRPLHSSVSNISQPAIGDCRGSTVHLGPSYAYLLLEWFANTPTSFLYVFALIALVVVFLKMGQKPSLTFCEKLVAHLKHMLQ